MKTDSTLRLGRVQYRQLAELAKQSGCCLGLSTFEKLESAWGMFNPFRVAVHADASACDPDLEERVVIELAVSVDAGRLRSVVRPEIDWAQLDDDEVFKFITHHEIGHYVDNHFGFNAFGLADTDARDKCLRVISFANEVLADRYAWSQIRPGEPVPLSENGKRQQEVVADALALLEKHIPRRRRAPRSLPSGQYQFVPQSMLLTDLHLGYVGPRVSPELVEMTRTRRRVHRRDTRQRAFA